MTKEEKIKEAYGKFSDVSMEICDENGWIKLGEYYTYFPIDTEKSECGWFIRPKSLSGIENNNGWQSVPSIHEKEIEKGQYFVCYRNGFIEVANYDGTMECYKSWKLNFTHYQPVVKPKPPIY